METSEVLNSTPTEIVAGTTVEWTMSLAHLPDDGYTANFRLSGASEAVTIAATQNDDAYDFALAPGDTEDFPIGDYYYQVTTEKAGEVHIEIAGTIRINGLVGSAGYDGSSVAKKIVDAIDALVLGRASSDQSSYQIGNRQLVRIPWVDLPATRKYYAAIVDAENRAARLKAGKSLWPSIKLRFGSRT